jgi:hypothetical protein
MQTFTRALLTWFLLAWIASAHAASFDGKWSGQMLSSAGSTIKVDLSISSAGGTLRLSPTGYVTNFDNPDQCHFRDIVVNVDSRTDSKLTFVVRGDLALIGCFKGAGALTMVDAKTLDGTLKDGRTFRLSRK